MRRYSLILVFIFTAAFCSTAYSQDSDSLKTARVKYISKDLSINTDKAQEVILIMDE